MNGTITILEALQITGVCMGIVFAALLAISYLIDVLRILLDRPDGDSAEPTTVSRGARADKGIDGKAPEELTTDEERAVAMIAAVEASGGVSDVKVKVVAVRQV